MWNLIPHCEIFKKQRCKESCVSEVVKVERRDAVAIVIVNSPPVNALSAAVRKGIADGVKSAEADASVKAIVIA